jgi:hypothetical protein
MNRTHLYRRPCACEAYQGSFFGYYRNYSAHSMALGGVIGYQQIDPASKQLMENVMNKLN